MPFADGAFDGAYMLHVGMNIEDKQLSAQRLAAFCVQETARIYQSDCWHRGRVAAYCTRAAAATGDRFS